MPLNEKIEKKLAGWKCKLISKGGRLQLVQSVLSSIPIYFMMCFRLPQWVINRIDSIRRRFLWGVKEGSTRYISLINWDTATLPRKWGGMEISNLNLFNIALLLRWWWQAYYDPDCLWSATLYTIKRISNNHHQPNLWHVGGSFFWK